MQAVLDAAVDAQRSALANMLVRIPQRHLVPADLRLYHHLRPGTSTFYPSGRNLQQHFATPLPGSHSECLGMNARLLMGLLQGHG